MASATTNHDAKKNVTKNEKRHNDDKGERKGTERNKEQR